MGDNRQSPLIIVWRDLLNIPYSVRPSLNDTYKNISFLTVEEGRDLSVGNVLNEFSYAIYATSGLLIFFIFLMIIACYNLDNRISHTDYMLDTRNLRSTYVHSITTLIVPEGEFHERAKFEFKKHSLFLFLVIACRIVYMFIFTFTFFVLVFQYVNSRSFYVLNQYSSFANDRDDKLLNISSEIEEFYNSETRKIIR